MQNVQNLAGLAIEGDAETNRGPIESPVKMRRPIKLRLRPEVVLHRLREPLEDSGGLRGHKGHKRPYVSKQKIPRGDLTLDETVYAALRLDLNEKRHVDMVFSYYNEVSERVEYKVDCHKIALAAKSSLIRKLLLQHEGMTY